MSNEAEYVSVEAESICAHCDEPIALAEGTWWHILNGSPHTGCDLRAEPPK